MDDGPQLRRHLFPVCFALCTLATLSPLWVAQHLPAVDVPQHLFLANVLRQLDDPASAYQQIYVARPGLTYLTFYYTVKLLGGPLGVETALRLWETLALGLIPLSLLTLLRALRRNKWLSLLAFPLVYTDNFYWGLISFQSSISLTIFAVAFFVRALEEPLGEWRGTIGLIVSLVLLQLTHAVGYIYPAIALPLMLLLSPSDFARRKRALLALIPGVGLFLAWLFSGVTKGRRFGAPGEPWKASAPLLDPRNFVFTPWKDRLERFVELLSNGFWDYADRPPLYGLAAVAVLIVVLAVWKPQDSVLPWSARARPLALLAVAVGCFLFLPSDITGYMYYLHPRYAQVAALLAILLLPFPAGLSYRWVAAAATLVAVVAGVHLAVLFKRFDVEADNFEMVARDLKPGAKIMHLIFDTGSRFATHAVYLHYAALGALRVNGVPSFSLAIDPSFPVGYREGAQPPAPASEWHPEAFNWREHGAYYDHFLLRGDRTPEEVFGPHLAELELASQADRWKLFRKRQPRR